MQQPPSSYAASFLVCVGLYLCLSACAVPSTQMPESSVYAPASLLEPYVPQGVPVEPSTAQSLALEPLLVFADIHSPIIQTAKTRLGLADADIVEAELILPANPMLEMGVGSRRIGGVAAFEFEVAIEQQFEIAGERGLRTEAAKRERDIQEAVVNEVRWSVHVEVHRMFVSLLLAYERRKQAQHFVDFVESLQQIAQQQVDAGSSSPLILLVAESELAQAREGLIDAVRYETELSLRLAIIVGWPASVVLPPVQGTLPPIGEVPGPDVLLTQMSEHHPALRKRELALLAKRTHLSLEEREAWPEPTLGISFAREAGIGGEPDADVWQVHIGLPVPLWDQNQGGLARAKAELHVADREREATARQLRGEVFRGSISLDASAQRVRLYETAIMPRLEEHLALLKRAFELGKIDVHQVSQMNGQLLDTAQRYLNARTDYYNTAAMLESLIGTELWLLK